MPGDASLTGALSPPRTSELLPQGPGQAEEHAGLPQAVYSHRGQGWPCLPTTSADTSVNPSNQLTAPPRADANRPCVPPSWQHRSAPRLQARELPPPERLPGQEAARQPGRSRRHHKHVAQSQSPAAKGSGFLPPALGQGSQLSTSLLQRTHRRTGKRVGKHPLNALNLSPKGDRGSSPKRPALTSARRGGGNWRVACRGGHYPGDGANPELKENVLFSTSTETDGETRYSTKRKKTLSTES